MVDFKKMTAEAVAPMVLFFGSLGLGAQTVSQPTPKPPAATQPDPQIAKLEAGIAMVDRQLGLETAPVVGPLPENTNLVQHASETIDRIFATTRSFTAHRFDELRATGKQTLIPDIAISRITERNEDALREFDRYITYAPLIQAFEKMLPKNNVPSFAARPQLPLYQADIDGKPNPAYYQPAAVNERAHNFEIALVFTKAGLQQSMPVIAQRDDFPQLVEALDVLDASLRQNEAAFEKISSHLSQTDAKSSLAAPAEARSLLVRAASLPPRAISLHCSN